MSNSEVDDVAWREYDVHEAYGTPNHQPEEEDEPNQPVDIFATPEEDAYKTEQYTFDNPSGEEVAISLREQEDYDVSTGISVWKGSEILRQYLVQHPSSIHKKRVLELGSGVGLCGIVASKVLGAMCVHLTDGDHVVLRNLRHNVELNEAANASCEQLIWGKDRAEEFGKRHGKFDTMLATDCVYITKSVRPLFETVATLLEPDGQFLFVNSCASTCPLEEVLRLAKELGFEAKEEDMWVPPQGEEDSGGGRDPVRVFRRR